ncbi:MAG TPA: S9 family peptidase [Prolixibacteraceae bacterium]|nr:S9 family peptidase [Prolixibacteraceae bacterium]
MKLNLIFTVAFCLLFSSFTPVSAQESLTETDYTRAVSFLWQNVNNKKAFNLNVSANWFADSTGFWYTVQDKTTKNYMKIDFATLKAEMWFDSKKLAELLEKELNEEVKATDLPIRELEYISKNELKFKAKNKNFKLDVGKYVLNLNEEKQEERNPMERKSPDGKWIAFTKDYNLFLKSTTSGEVRQLSHSGVKNYEYASYYGWDDIIEGENGERPAHFNVSWSPDSKWIATNICDLRSANKMYLLNWSIDSLYRPKLLSYYRGSPGDTNMVYMIPVLFDVENGREIRPDLPRNTHINQVSTRWSETGETLFADYATRGFQNQYVLTLDMKTLQMQTLIHEQSNTNIDNFFYVVLEKMGKILFASERSGWRQLYLLDMNSKAVTHLAPDNYYVNDIQHIDEKTGTIYFTASGKEQGVNPYQQYLYSVSLRTNKIQLLTPENVNHDISFSPDGKYFTDNQSTAQQPTTTVLRESATGNIVTELAKADISALQAMNWAAPHIFTVTARDGKTEIFGALWKPSNFDPDKKYPIIDNSYTGPHTQMFPRNFARVLSINNQALAELGFVVMMVDGLGSSGRSKAFHDVSYKNMGLSLTDHVLAIQQLAAKYAWIDAERVGIFGHSAGGYDAGHALLQFPDFYKVGVASSGDHDHRMEKAWWPEMYMGWPVDSAYHKQSNVTMAANLKGKLLLVHGGIDENVNPSATFKLAENLVRADKQFDLLILPSQRHGYTGKFADYFTKKRWNYFVEHLLGKKPIWEFSLEEKP